jgi:hypothetical protein
MSKKSRGASMIPKSGDRFSEKDHAQCKNVRRREEWISMH